MDDPSQAERVERESVTGSLRRVAERLEGSPTLRSGTAVLHLRGADGGDYHLDSDARSVRLRDAGAAASSGEPMLEVFAEAETLRAILDGAQDATEQFLAGGIRVRGDLRLLSDVALELGLIKQPL
jgi:hypothetical protein